MPSGFNLLGFFIALPFCYILAIIIDFIQEYLSVRIGFDAKRYFENKTGLGSFSRSLINSLITNYPENEYFLYTPDKPDTKHISKILDISKIKIRYPKISQKHYWRSRGILNELITDRIELYHGLSNEIPFGIHKTSIKSVVTIHDLLFKEFRKDYNFVDRMVYSLKTKYACQYADKVVAISKSTKESILKNYNIESETVAVIYQDIDPIFKEPRDCVFEEKVLKTLAIPEEYLLFVGNDSERKNLITVMKALSHIKEKPKMVLLLNKNEIKNKIQKIVDRNSLSDSISIVTKIPIETLKALYSKAKCLIYPSLGEGWGLPPEEAIACLTPAIVPKFAPFKEQFSNGKIFVDDPTDANELAKKMEFIWSKRKIIIEEMIKNHNTYDSYQQIYKCILFD